MVPLRSDPARLRPTVRDARRRDYVSVIEAAYDAETDDNAWFASLLQTARGPLGGMGGIFGWFFEHSKPKGGPWNLHIKRPLLLGCSPALVDAFSKTSLDFAPSDGRRLYTSRDCCAYLSQVMVSSWSRIGRHFHSLGIGDFLVIFCSDLDGSGCTLGVPVAALKRLHPRRREALSRVAAHVAAALRLRRVRASAASGADAILNAAKVMGESLRRENPERAVALWRALVAGRWSLVELDESDGRRLLMARRNGPKAIEHRALGQDERRVAGFAAMGHPTKLIAYELGLPISTTSGLLYSALGKLGLSSRAELIRIFGAPSLS